MGRRQAERAAAAAPRMFVTDYDGTLLTDARRIHGEDHDALSRLRARGVVTAIATGRSLFSFVRSLETMGLCPSDLPVDFLVFSTGAGIMDLGSGSIIRSLDLPLDRVREACAFFDGQKFDYMVHRAIPDTPYFRYRSHGHPNPDFQARMALYPAHGTPLDHHGPEFDSATEVLAIVPRDALTLSREEIQAALGRTSVIFATSPLDHRSMWIEVFHEDVSKSSSVAWLADRLGMGAGQVVSVGNDYNDQDLLEWSGLGYVVENGPEDLGAGVFRVRSNNCGGVSQAAQMAGLL